MEQINRQQMIRGALLLALAIIFQGLRFILPLPPLGGMFLIGVLVNMTLFLAVRHAGFGAAMVLGMLLPIIAFVQGQLPIPVVIPVVAAGNMVLVVLYQYWKDTLWIWLIPVGKAAVLYGGCLLLLSWLAIPEKVAVILLTMMSWPQIVTATAGLWLARSIEHKLPR